MDTQSVPVFCGVWARDGCVLCCGGGGATRSGLGNLLIVARANGHSIEQLHTRSTGLDAPYRLAIHPNGSDFVCSFIACHGEKLEVFRLADDMSIESTGREIVVATEQTAMAFSVDGTMFATAGKNGHFRVFKWPSLELLLEEQCTIGSAEFKSVDFSDEGTLVAASTNDGSTYLWELHGQHRLRVIPSPKGRYCWFSRGPEPPELHVASNEGHVTTWSGDWTRPETRKQRFCQDRVSAFSCSSDGKLLAMGSGGDVFIVDAATLRVVQRVRAAQSFAVTAVGFSKDKRYFLSTSLSGGLRVSERRDSNLLVTWSPMLVFVLAFLVFLLTLFAAG